MNEPLDVETSSSSSSFRTLYFFSVSTLTVKCSIRKKKQTEETFCDSLGKLSLLLSKQQKNFLEREANEEEN